jgi:hypothetical protein
MRATMVLLELYLAYLRLHWAGAGELVLESSHGARENEPPKEAGLLVPPGAPYKGCPGDKGSPTIHYTCTVDEFDYWGLVILWPASARYRPRYCALRHGHGLVPSMSVLGVLAFVF